MNTPEERLVHGELVLRRWRRGDIDALTDVVVASLEHLRPWMPFALGTYDRNDAAQYLASSEREWDTGTAYSYAITIGGRLIGSCGLHRRIAPTGLEIGYWVCSRDIRRGYATRATQALIAQARGLTDVDYVEIHHDLANTASAAIPRRLGFTEVGSSVEEAGPLSPGESGVNVVWRLMLAESTPEG